MPLQPLFAAVARPWMMGVAWALPPRCPACGTPVVADHRFCAPCWGGLRFLGPPWCEGCNLPLPYAIDGGRCAQCLAKPPRHAGVRAAVAYGPAARAIALRLKYGGRLGLAETIARQMVRLVPADADLLIPVPLHRWRLWHRGFNQAALIAQRLGIRTGIRVAADCLRRERATPVLRGMGPSGRRKAVQGAFSLAPAADRVLAGRHVVLIDDVHTSGATSDACVRVLLAGGARAVTVLCWARVLPGADRDGVRPADWAD